MGGFHGTPREQVRAMCHDVRHVPVIYSIWKTPELMNANDAKRDGDDESHHKGRGFMALVEAKIPTCRVAFLQSPSRTIIFPYIMDTLSTQVALRVALSRARYRP